MKSMSDIKKILVEKTKKNVLPLILASGSVFAAGETYNWNPLQNLSTFIDDIVTFLPKTITLVILGVIILVIVKFGHAIAGLLDFGAMMRGRKRY